MWSSSNVYPRAIHASWEERDLVNLNCMSPARDASRAEVDPGIFPISCMRHIRLSGSSLKAIAVDLGTTRSPRSAHTHTRLPRFVAICTNRALRATGVDSAAAIGLQLRELVTLLTELGGCARL
ncbi:hypothetical protein NUW54_g2613 [Trametes sanguinea]|uniref:Uncharacterized protein n=1 Tax=Trametes sanguinea TaxID=158606 RepID=A0ACC1Q4R6_9APHY|nr:hypothetical protein NUW54_g2613 [Trametes sanguinea]